MEFVTESVIESVIDELFNLKFNSKFDEIYNKSYNINDTHVNVNTHINTHTNLLHLLAENDTTHMNDVLAIVKSCLDTKNINTLKIILFKFQVHKYEILYHIFVFIFELHYENLIKLFMDDETINVDITDNFKNTILLHVLKKCIHLGTCNVMYFIELLNHHNLSKHVIEFMILNNLVDEDTISNILIYHTSIVFFDYTDIIKHFIIKIPLSWKFYAKRFNEIEYKNLLRYMNSVGINNIGGKNIKDYKQRYLCYLIRTLKIKF